MPTQPSRVADVLRVARQRPRDRRDPNVPRLRDALLEAPHFERSALASA